jgi:hypothetical protein
MPRTTDAPPPAVSTTPHPTATADPGRRRCAVPGRSVPPAVRDAIRVTSVRGRFHQGKPAASRRAPGPRPGPCAGGGC